MDKILDNYLEYIRNEKKLSENTIFSYKRDLKIYTDYLSDNKIKLHKVKKVTILTFLIYLQKDGKTTATISRTLSSIRSLHNYLYENKLAKNNPTLNLQSPKSEKKLPVILTSKEVELLLSQPDENDFKGYRDKAMLELLYATGIRVSELTELKLGDVDADIGLIRCASEKGERTIPVYSLAARCLKEYIEKSKKI